MRNFLAIVKRIWKFTWKHKASTLLILLLLSLFRWPQENSKISIGEEQLNFKLPVGMKLIALREREKYFNVWINQKIARNIQSPEEKVDKIFDWINKFKRPEDFDNKDFHNIEQHEYYTLINQYGYTNQLVRVFCLLVTVAGYQAIPFESEADGRVIVRIPGTDEWLKYNLNKTSGKDIREINLSEEVKQDIRDIDTGFKKLCKGRYTRGDQNTLGNRIWFEIQKRVRRSPTYIDAVKNDTLWPSD